MNANKHRPGNSDRTRPTGPGLTALGLTLAATVGCQLLIWLYVDPAARYYASAPVYLMAHFLLTRQPEALLENLGQLEDAAGSSLPRHLAEAMLLLDHVRPGQAIDLEARTIDPEITRRFERFLRAAPSPNPAQVPPPALDRDFGDTYWFYAWFGKTHGRAHRQSASR